MSQGGNYHGDGMTMSGGDGGGMGYPPRVMMWMSFHWGQEAVVLFSGWPGESSGMFMLCLLFIFFLAVALEILHLTPNGKPEAASTIRGSLGRAVIHGLRLGMAYLVMLAVMSFNSGIFIAAILGHAFGFFIGKARADAVANRALANNSTGGSDKA